MNGKMMRMRTTKGVGRAEAEQRIVLAGTNNLQHNRPNKPTEQRQTRQDGGDHFKLKGFNRFDHSFGRLLSSSFSAWCGGKRNLARRILKLAIINTSHTYTFTYTYIFDSIEITCHRSPSFHLLLSSPFLLSSPLLSNVLEPSFARQ